MRVCICIRILLSTLYHAARFIYWDKLAEIYDNIFRVMGFRGAARFQGNIMVIMMHLYYYTHNAYYIQTLFT